MAAQPVADLRAAGLPAVRAEGQPPPRPGDIVIKGSFYGIEEGSTGRRVMLGFGSGAAEFRAAVEGYRMTPDGLRRPGGGTTDSEGDKAPGMGAPIAVFAATRNPLGLIVVGAMKARGERTGSDTIAAQLKAAAEKQGWIQSVTPPWSRPVVSRIHVDRRS